MTHHRRPQLGDLVEFLIELQPEFDESAAVDILRRDVELTAMVAQACEDRRTLADSLLELHFNLRELEEAQR